ncbi:LuxR family transcriptional regulator [Shigella boydii]|uniref:LuxR family transcriptional regulator n=2 Tax=Shigella dysenteriae TaxID=622 RepID=A0A3P6KFZ2_SHIDY|nr:hypothetical protein SD22575_0015 [Shigella dysenteriae 225-75]VDG86656.1 LuxR family transcriptional regulator [Shigella dysenteriae]
MQIVMFDRQSIFIHGMKISLQQRIPGVSIQGASQADELWQKLESYPEALVMLDGDQDGEFCYWLLQKTVVQFPEVKVLITATDCNKRWLQEVIHFNVLAIVPRDSTVEEGQINWPSSRRLVNRHRPSASAHRILIMSPRRPRKMNR